jgi:hypothetical protein
MKLNDAKAVPASYLPPEATRKVAFFPWSSPFGRPSALGEGLTPSRDQIDPKLRCRWNAKVVHRHSNHIFICRFELGNERVRELENLLLLRAAVFFRSICGGDPLRGHGRQLGLHQISGNHSSIRVESPPPLHELFAELSRN